MTKTLKLTDEEIKSIVKALDFTEYSGRGTFKKDDLDKFENLKHQLMNEFNITDLKW